MNKFGSMFKQCFNIRAYQENDAIGNDTNDYEQVNDDQANSSANVESPSKKNDTEECSTSSQNQNEKASCREADTTK